MPYWQHYCHLVWATKHRGPQIDDANAEIIRHVTRATCNAHRATLHAIGMMPDHVHLAVSIPPRVAIADFIRAVKSASSFEINHDHTSDSRPTFGWQAEYGLLSFGQRSLESVVAYINNQAAHHAANTLWPTFEILESAPPPSR
jgi:putative transposase